MRQILRYAFGCAYCTAFSAILLIWGIFVIIVSTQTISDASNHTSTSNTTDAISGERTLDCFELMSHAVFDDACSRMNACYFVFSSSHGRLIYMNDTAHAIAHPCNDMWTSLRPSGVEYTADDISAGIRCVHRSNSILSNYDDHMTASARLDGRCDVYKNEQPKCMGEDGEPKNVYVCAD